MDPPIPPAGDARCPCNCPCCGAGQDLASAPPKESQEIENFARVEIEDEAMALRETLASHQVSVQELSRELEEERSAASSAATEAMSMILRLQREKAETQMEARQFKGFAEEKMAHDLAEITELEDIVYKRDQEIQSLSCEVQSYRHRLLSFGIGFDREFGFPEPFTPDASAVGVAGSGSDRFDFPSFEYPQLRCRVPGDDVGVDMDKYPFGETPREQLQHLEQRIYQLERMPSSSRHSVVMDKGVVGFSPGFPRHLRRFSTDSYGDEFPSIVDRGSEAGWRDDVSDRVYTVDAVHGPPENYVYTPREALAKKNVVVNGEEDEMKKLYMRLQALEADRESMRQTIIAMGTDKAQALLMKEIAQQLCKEGAPENRIVKKHVSAKRFSLLSVLKCVVSVVLWRRKPSPIKYTFGQSSNNAGLLVLLDKSPCLRQRKFLTKSQGH